MIDYWRCMGVSAEPTVGIDIEKLEITVPENIQALLELGREEPETAPADGTFAPLPARKQLGVS